MESRRGRLWGLLLVAPAALAWATTLVWPLVQLVRTSLVPTPLLHREGPFSNYSLLFEGDVIRRFGFGLSLGLLPLLVFVAVGLGVGWAGNRSGRALRMTARWALVLPMACFVPAMVVTAWLWPGGLEQVLPGGRAHRPPVTDLRVLVLFGTFGLACGVGSLVYLAALRGRRPGRTVAAVTVLAVLTALALGVQQFTTPLLAGQLTPQPRSHLLPVVSAHRDVERASYEVPAAQLVLVFVVVAVLGLAATAVLLRARVEVAVEPDQPPPAATTSPAGRMVLLAVVAVVVVAGGVLLWPWLRILFGAGHTPPRNVPRLLYDAGPVLANTWLSPLPSVVFGLATAVAAAVGIGVLRPLGRHSDLLLLPFAPWLLGTVAPLALARAASADPPSRLLASQVWLTPSSWLNVAAMVGFTLLLRGQAPAYRAAVSRGLPAGRAAVESYLRPVLPAVGLVAAFCWVAQANDLTWPKLAVSRGGRLDQASTLALYEQGLRLAEDRTRVVTPVVAVLLVLVLLAAAQPYLDRLTIRTRPGPTPAPPALSALDAPTVRLPALPALVVAAPSTMVSLPVRRQYRGVLWSAGLGLALAAVALTVSCADNPDTPQQPLVVRPGVSPGPVASQQAPR